ncbi:hypothetical protein SAMN05192534_10194 [Alteribacillus persepolensis]|uniref:Short-chain dehydrogenase n=1 Tax=Alteribacillus persepolensis TaxID=568899 RepID=A0A1G7YCV4_9BACI|nr:SDR family oxidoreductase [Alteribacillus persepolensis]SDG94382.1 hypothetical protein SAMN05192534_10194 [Alteribacillus persepolensis]
METTKQNIVITGASSGIGESLARMAATQGHYPVLMARSKKHLQRIQRDIQADGGACSIYVCDVTDEQQVKQTAASIMDDVKKVDILINNAGLGRFMLTEETTAEDAKAMVDVNILGLFYVVKAVLPFMKAKKQGHIINIGSQAGRLATPKSSMYAATKHALIGFSNALRLETEPDGIFVSTVNPGPVKTSFFQKADPSGRYEKSIKRFAMETDDVAKQVWDAAIEKRKREVNIPKWMAAVSKLHAMFPGLIETLGKRQFYKK